MHLRAKHFGGIGGHLPAAFGAAGVVVAGLPTGGPSPRRPGAAAGTRRAEGRRQRSPRGESAFAWQGRLRLRAYWSGSTGRFRLRPRQLLRGKPRRTVRRGAGPRWRGRPHAVPAVCGVVPVCLAGVGHQHCRLRSQPRRRHAPAPPAGRRARSGLGSHLAAGSRQPEFRTARPWGGSAPSGRAALRVRAHPIPWRRVPPEPLLLPLRGGHALEVVSGAGDHSTARTGTMTGSSLRVRLGQGSLRRFWGAATLLAVRSAMLGAHMLSRACSVGRAVSGPSSKFVEACALGSRTARSPTPRGSAAHGPHATWRQPTEHLLPGPLVGRSSEDCTGWSTWVPRIVLVPRRPPNCA